MIAVIDYRAGNLTSVVKTLGYLGARDVVVTQRPEVVRGADRRSPWDVIERCASD